MGSTKDWFPSRRSVANQRGGLSMVLEGHCRLGKWSGWKGLYLLDGTLSLAMKRPVSRGLLSRLIEMNLHRHNDSL